MMPGPPPVMTAKPFASEILAQFASLGVVRVVLVRPGRAEDGDGLADGRQGIEAFHELGQDAQRAPRVRVQEGRPVTRRQQPLVLGSGVDGQHLGRLGAVGHATASAPVVRRVAVVIAVRGERCSAVRGRRKSRLRGGAGRQVWRGRGSCRSVARSPALILFFDL
jgi:hypothetical protein